MIKREVLALLRILDMCDIMLVTREIKMLNQYSSLDCLVQSSGINGRLGRWTALLWNRTLEARRFEKGEDERLGTLAASITPRAEVDELLIVISLQRQQRQTITIPPPTGETDENLLVISFESSASTTRKRGAYCEMVCGLL